MHATWSLVCILADPPKPGGGLGPSRGRYIQCIRLSMYVCPEADTAAASKGRVLDDALGIVYSTYISKYDRAAFTACRSLQGVQAYRVARGHVSAVYLSTARRRAHRSPIRLSPKLRLLPEMSISKQYYLQPVHSPCCDAQKASWFYYSFIDIALAECQV